MTKLKIQKKDFLLISDVIDINQSNSSTDSKKKTSVGNIVTAIETRGFFSWDRYGRFMYIGTENNNCERKRIIIKLREELSILSSSTTTNLTDLIDPQGQIFKSGWPPEELPDFDELEKVWNRNEGKKDKAPKRPEIKNPSSQSKIYDVFAVLLIEKYGPEILTDITSGYSKKASLVIKDLEKLKVNIDAKTLKKYVKDSNMT